MWNGGRYCYLAAVVVVAEPSLVILRRHVDQVPIPNGLDPARPPGVVLVM